MKQRRYYKTLMGMYRYAWRMLGRKRGTKYAHRYARFVGDGYEIPEITR